MSHRGKALRKIADSFVIAAPAGARVRTRIFANDTDALVLQAIGTHLGSLASADLARRTAEGRLNAKAKAESRRERKRGPTGLSSSRWAGAITRTTEDSYGLAKRNLQAERTSLIARIKKIRGRVAIAPGETKGRRHGYASAQERWEKQRRAQVLSSRLKDVEAQLASGAYTICRGGKRMANNRHNLEAAGKSPKEWRAEWEASRWFITADGEKDQLYGNLTIRWNPIDGWLEIKLPKPLAHLANRDNGRYRLSSTVSWPHRGDEVAAQATSGAVRYDISFDPTKRRWYIDASWRTGAGAIATDDQLRRAPVVAIDLNVGHLAVAVLDCYGNPIGSPVTIPLVLSGLPTTARDARIRSAISQVLAIAGANHAGSVVIENLSFDQARIEGREHTGNRPSRGERGKTFRRHISGLPTATLRDRLTQMAHNAGVSVIAVDPAYTSKWGAEHWLDPLKTAHPKFSPTGHHAAAVAIGRRGLGQRARQRTRCDSTPAAHGEERATRPVVRPKGAGEPALLSKQRMRETGTREARGQPQTRCKTRRAERSFPVDQVAQDRSGPPARRDLVPLSV